MLHVIQDKPKNNKGARSTGQVCTRNDSTSLQSLILVKFFCFYLQIDRSIDRVIPITGSVEVCHTIYGDFIH